MPPTKQEMFSFFKEKLLYIQAEQVRANRAFAATELFSYILDHFEAFDAYASTQLADSIYKKCKEILSDVSLHAYDELVVVCETLHTKLSNLLRTRIARSYGALASDICV